MYCVEIGQVYDVRFADERGNETGETGTLEVCGANDTHWMCKLDGVASLGVPRTAINELLAGNRAVLRKE